MIDELKAVLLQSAAEWNVPAQNNWRFLFFNNYQPNYSTMTVLWFDEGGSFPRVVTKVFRDSTVPKQEWENLSFIQSRIPRVAPRPLRFGPAGKFWALWMEGLPGLPLSSQSTYSRQVLRSIVESVISMHAAVRKPAGFESGDRHARLVTAPLQALADYGDSTVVRGGCARLAAALPAEALQSLSVVPQHGDLFDGNALIDHDRCRLLDWETYGILDLPFYDLVTLFYSMLRRRGDSPGAWDSSLVTEIAPLTSHYAAALEIPRPLLRALVPLSLANWFHIHWRDGRKDFASRMYRTIEACFQDPAAWELAFLGRAA